MIKAIIFDFDGVIHNTLDIAFETNKKVLGNKLHSLKEYKNLFDSNVYKNIGITKEHIAKFFDIQEKEYDKLKINEKVRNSLLSLKERYDLFIISSNKEKTINKYFSNNNVKGIFKDILGYETDKSKEVKFKIIFSRYNLKKDECVFVTDTLGHILEANNVKIKTIAVDFGYHEKERLIKGNPLRIISEFEEIPLIVKEIR